MTKQDIINQMAAITGLQKTQCEDALNAIATVIHTELKCGNEIVLPAIGKFSLKLRPAREGRNPSTGEKLHIPAKSVVSFKALKALKDCA